MAAEAGHRARLVNYGRDNDVNVNLTEFRPPRKSIGSSSNSSSADYPTAASAPRPIPTWADRDRGEGPPAALLLLAAGGDHRFRVRRVRAEPFVTCSR